MTVTFEHNNYSSKNYQIWLIEKLFYHFSVTNNAVLLEVNWKGLNLLKGGNKPPFKDLKICKAVESKHERTMFLPVGWKKLHSSKLN